jgi:hypothetical protein
MLTLIANITVLTLPLFVSSTDKGHEPERILSGS